jgi:hypothetical protein
MDRCSLCTDLWRAYARATTEHVQLIKEQESPASADLARFESLEARIEIAGGTRERARLAIKRHLAKDHLLHAVA